ncbi:hypothetical protein SCOCK_160014 [Actinacidiphila cocklensis]|uniref:Uncharacterized protein n=1 Tax=Actinacidiphila cocklensis TaxID=887465 RepID=A0A9W4GR41_9ACTN|nr:hypothetical protein SCOCK_160014 [Actinacidiphila cocklensis]
MGEIHFRGANEPAGKHQEITLATPVPGGCPAGRFGPPARGGRPARTTCSCTAHRPARRRPAGDPARRQIRAGALGRHLGGRRGRHGRRGARRDLALPARRPGGRPAHGRADRHAGHQPGVTDDAGHRRPGLQLGRRRQGDHLGAARRRPRLSDQAGQRGPDPARHPRRRRRRGHRGPLDSRPAQRPHPPRHRAVLLPVPAAHEQGAGRPGPHRGRQVQLGHCPGTRARFQDHQQSGLRDLRQARCRRSRTSDCISQGCGPGTWLNAFSCTPRTRKPARVPHFRFPAADSLVKGKTSPVDGEPTDSSLKAVARPPSRRKPIGAGR